MLTIIHGGTKEAKEQLLADIVIKSGNVSLVSLYEETFSEISFLSYIYGETDLFGERVLLVLRNCLINETIRSIFESRVEAIQGSLTHIICIEDPIPQTDLAKFKKHKVEIIALGKITTVTKKESFSPFALGEALLSKDKKKLWLVYQDALASGLTAQDILPPLIWQIKVLAIVTLGISQKDSGVSEYPYKKAKQASSHFSKDEILSLLAETTLLFHEIRLVAYPKDRLELFLLKAFK